jgi:hypothetical protein
MSYLKDTNIQSFQTYNAIIEPTVSKINKVTAVASEAGSNSQLVVVSINTTS